jgi:hypothetical protein
MAPYSPLLFLIKHHIEPYIALYPLIVLYRAFYFLIAPHNLLLPFIVSYSFL